MKREFPKMQRNAVVFMAVIGVSALMCAFTMVDKELTNPPKVQKPVVSFAHLNPQPDSMTVSILGEDVAAIVFGTKKATLSYLNSKEKSEDGKSYKVVCTLGTLNKADLNTIRFLMADSTFYNSESDGATTPFSPNYALSFVKGKHKIDLVFSLVSFQMGIFKDDKLTKVVCYNNALYVTRFFRLVSQNEIYDKLISIQ